MKNSLRKTHLKLNRPPLNFRLLLLPGTECGSCCMAAR